MRKNTVKIGLSKYFIVKSNRHNMGLAYLYEPGNQSKMGTTHIFSLYAKNIKLVCPIKFIHLEKETEEYWTVGIKYTDVDGIQQSVQATIKDDHIVFG